MSKLVGKTENIYHSDTLVKLGNRVKMCVAKEIFYEKRNPRKTRISGAKNVKESKQKRKPFSIQKGTDDKVQTNLSRNYAETACQRT